MSLSLRTLLGGVFALVFAAAGYFVYQWQSGAADDFLDPVATGQRVLAAKLTGLDGQLQPLDQWRGKVMVVNFWATWCAPCREEIPGFIKFQEQYATRGVQFIGIAIDLQARVVPYIKEMGINYPVLIGGFENMDFARTLGNRLGVLPFTLVIDRSGKVTSTIVGVLKPEKLEYLLKPLL